MPALRRSVYIGLGGAGIRSIMNTKKLFIEAYGEVPPMVKFVGMDTDAGELERATRVEFGLNYTEIVRLQGHRSEMLPREWYEWIPQEYRHVLLNDINFPASQTRSLGRFALLWSFRAVRQAVQNAIDTSASYSYGTDSRNVPEFDGKVQVNLVFSLVGGTGSGIFLDVAYMIRKLFGNRVGLNGYAILPGCYCGCGSSILSNAYASLMELDYLMRLGPQDEPVTFNWISNSFSADDFRATPRPFDWVYLIDNKNEAGNLLSSPREVYDVVGLALFAAGGAVGFQNDVMLDGMRYSAEENGYWAIGIGMASIVYFKDRVAKVYACKIALKTIERMLDGRDDGDMFASILLSHAVENASTRMRHLDGLLHERLRMMQTVKDRLEKVLPELERDRSRHPFTYLDLATADIDHVVLEDVAPRNDDFMAFLGEGGMEEVESEDALWCLLIAYAESRPEYLQMKDTNVHDAVRALPVDEAEELLNAARQYSSPYLPLIGMSSNPSMNLVRDVIVGVENTYTNPFPPQLLNSYPEPLQCVSTGLPDRVLFFSKIALFPICSIEGIRIWKEAYERVKDRLSPHIDVELQERMEREGYDL